jgi:TRAP-type uncharacterized transport system fused permease subunit
MIIQYMYWFFSHSTQVFWYFGDVLTSNNILYAVMTITFHLSLTLWSLEDSKNILTKWHSSLHVLLYLYIIIQWYPVLDHVREVIFSTDQSAMNILGSCERSYFQQTNQHILCCSYVQSWGINIGLLKIWPLSHDPIQDIIGW